jgi:hypothetical protein
MLIATIVSANVNQAKQMLDDIRSRDPFILPVQEKGHTLIISPYTM